MIDWLFDDTPFPPSAKALKAPNGLLAAGGDLSVQRLLMAYRGGIYPWYNESDPILWWTPDPRMVLRLSEFKLHRSLRKTWNKWACNPQYRVTCDTAFEQVIQHCAGPRSYAEGTWIVSDIVQAYTALHAAGYAHSVESWVGDQLVGGLYLVNLGTMVFGESMFSHRTDASKIALACLVKWLMKQGADMIDCQQNTQHLASLGAREMPRTEFERAIAQRVVQDRLIWPSGSNWLQL